MDTVPTTPASAPEFGSDASLLQLRSGVLFLLNRVVREPWLAEDLCNETFRVVLERLRRQPLEHPGKLASYLAQTARNLAIADRRRTSRRQTVTGEQSAIDDFADEKSDPSVKLESQSRANAIRKVLNGLPNLRDRQLLVRLYLYDEDKASICRDLHLTEEHFNRVVYRARERFRILLDKRFDRPDLLCLALA
ncbi:MAG: sigma-70 family RNA polymerase sigma factor [Steroidobacteraceae bacterium]